MGLIAAVEMHRDMLASERRLLPAVSTETHSSVENRSRRHAIRQAMRRRLSSSEDGVSNPSPSAHAGPGRGNLNAATVLDYRLAAYCLAA
jgi:hypothetical protein